MKKIFKLFVYILGILLTAVATLVLYLTVTEYKPAAKEELVITNNGQNQYELNKKYTVLNWNIGFAGLDKNADFFMDGGKGVLPNDKKTVESNFQSILAFIKNKNADINFLQEVDEKAKRSFGLNQVAKFNENLIGANFFAYNFKVNYIPYPLPTMLGNVQSGIYTNSKYMLDNAVRYQLPVPFKYPTRIANLKRAFTVAYAPVANSNKKLLLINVHLEAYYADNNGKIAQLKELANFLSSEYEKGNYIVVGGDFNQAINDITEEEIAEIPENLWRPKKFVNEDLPNGFKIKYDAKTPSARLLDKPYVLGSNHYTYYIDGFIVSDNVNVLKTTTEKLNFEHSDHNPVILEFELK